MEGGGAPVAHRMKSKDVFRAVFGRHGAAYRDRILPPGDGLLQLPGTTYVLFAEA